MEPTITAVATGVASLGAGFFGWLRGRSETATAQAKAALIAAIEADPPAWWSPAIATIFDETL